MKFKFLLLFTLAVTVYSCSEDRDDNGVFAGEINDFVWKGMNFAYLYKDFMPNLANDRFSTDQEYADYLNNSGTPEYLFESLIYQRSTIDRFSWIVDDYIALEQQFDGITRNNGMDFGLRRVPGSSSLLYGYVRLVLPNSNAETQGLKRGDVFDGIDGTQLTIDNYRTLLASDNYSIDLATYDDNGTPETDDDTIISGTESVALTKVAYTENPIFISDVLNVGGDNVGYLMYNGFVGTNQFDSELNSVFHNFSSNNITDLVLDLRYNSGGSVNTAIWLSCMITGQFNGQIFTTEEWNNDRQSQLEASNPTALENRFVDTMIKRNRDGDIVFQETINSLNLNKVYILTTGSSASASELVINGLNPYIDVVQIGTTTVGKYQASITIYDSPNFGRDDANPNHTYAMQPLVLKEINAVGFTDFDNGLAPDIIQEENIANLGVLGDEDEPLLATALAEIAGSRASVQFIEPVDLIGDSKDFIRFGKEMYIEKEIPISEKVILNIDSLTEVKN